MTETAERALAEKGLRRILNLDEVLTGGSFFADSSYDSDIFKAFAVYPITRKANLAHNLLNLYGTHWRYAVDYGFKEATKLDGDTETVLKDARLGIREDRHAVFAYTQKYVDMASSMWIFVPETPGWEFQERVLVPRFASDLEQYRIEKRKARLEGLERKGIA